MLAASLAIDKLVFKRLLGFHGIPQVEFCEAGADGWREQAAAMGLPLWVKPARLGSSVGISKVTSPEGGLDEAVELAARHDPRVIVEADGGGREVECSVLGNDEPDRLAARARSWPTPIGTTTRPSTAEGGMELVVPAPNRRGRRSRGSASSRRRVFTAIGGSGLARCDFFVRDDGEVLVNEINTIPGFTSTSVFAKLFEADGIPYPELCDRLVRLALERYEAERAYRF